MKRHDITVLSKESIPEILEYFDIETSTCGLSKPAYNPYRLPFFFTNIKKPPKNLLGVYFKPRINPFNEKYPDEDDEYTLEDLLKYEIAIEDAFVFWDAPEKSQEDQSQINLVVSDIFTDQNKEEVINHYLIENNIIQEPKLIKLGCYNATPHTGLVLPLPPIPPHKVPIDAVYFDDGIRILPEDQKTRSLKWQIEWQQEYQHHLQKDLEEQKAKPEQEQYKAKIQEFINKQTEKIKTSQQDIIKCQLYTIEDLLKLSNGAKNIYLFIFNVKKRTKIIELPDSSKPYSAIRTWKRENNLYTFPPLIKEGEYDEEIKEAEISFEITSCSSYKKFNIPFKIKNISHLFETNNTIYLILCNDSSLKIKLAYQYRTNYINWLKQCYIKYGCYYSSSEIREKLGRCSCWLYDENGNSYWYSYEKGFFYDDWYIDGNETAKTHYRFLDTTRPPQKPTELNL